MACRVTLKDGTTLNEAEFYNWLHDNLDRLKEEGKINLTEAEKEKKLRESAGVKKRVREFVKTTVKKLNQMVYGAEEAGAKTGATYMKKKIDALQKAAIEFLDESKIDRTPELEREIGKIRSEVGLGHFLLSLQHEGDYQARQEKVTAIKKLINQAWKLRKNKNITVSDRQFIRSLDFPSPNKVSDLDSYEKLLSEFIDRRKGGKITTDIENQLEEFLKGESAYINSYEEQIQSIKDIIKEAELEEEYKKSGFDGTFEEFVAAKEKGELTEQQQQAIQPPNIAEQIKETIAENADAIKEALGNSSLPFDFALFDNIDALSADDLVMLNNILDGIIFDGDLSNLDLIMSKLRLSDKKRVLDMAMFGRKFREIITNKLRDVRATINEVVYGKATRAAFMDYVLGQWDGAIAKMRKQHNTAMTKFDEFANKLGKNRFESMMKIDTYAFINQWFDDMTNEQRDEHFQARYKKKAQDAQSQYKLNNTKTPSTANTVELNKSVATLKALEDMGLISNLTFGDEATFDIQTKTPDDIVGTLSETEQKFYDFLLGQFASLTNIPDAIKVGLGQEFNPIVNYFPTFAISQLEDENRHDEQDIQQLMAGFTGVARTQGRAKKRGDVAGTGFSYSSGLRESFSKGYWEALLINDGVQQTNDMVNIIYSNVGLNSLKGISPASLKVIKDAVKSQVVRDLKYGNVPTNTEKMFTNEIKKALTSSFVGYILKHYNQLVKQSVAPLLTNIVTNPKASFYAFNLIRGGVGIRALAQSVILNNTSVLDRHIKYLQTPFAKDYPIEYVFDKKGKAIFKASRGLSKLADNVGDIVVPVAKLLGYKTQFDSLLEMSDALVSEINVYTGYIDRLLKENPKMTYEDIIAHLSEGKPNTKALASAEEWQKDMNSISNQNAAADVIKDRNAAGMLYFMKSFSLATHQAFLNNYKQLVEKGVRDNLTGAEKADAVQGIAKYVIQQLVFRMALQQVVSISMKSIMGGGDDDDPWKSEKNKYAVASGLLGDIFMGSSSVWFDIMFSISFNYVWQKHAENIIEENGLTKEDIKGTSLDPARPFQYQNKVGGSVAGLIEEPYKIFKEYEKDAEVLVKAGLSKTYAILVNAAKLLPIIFGSGTGRDAVSLLDKDKDRKLAVISAISSELQTSGVQFQLDQSDLEKIAEKYKGTDFIDVRNRVFVEKDEDGKPYKLHIVDEKVIEKFRKEAMDELGFKKISDSGFKEYLEDNKMSFVKGDGQKRVIAERAIRNKTQELIKKDLEDMKTESYKVKKID